MRVTHLQSKKERKAALRQAILRRAPSISADCLDKICESINVNRSYFIKATADKQKFMNLITRETIITEDVRAFSDILPLYGSFQPPFFEKSGCNRFCKDGFLDTTGPAAAVKIRVGSEKKRSSVTYSLLIYLAD